MEEFIGKNYNIPQLDLSERPENTPEKYAYLYEQTVVDDSESYLGHPDSVLLKNGDILTVYPHGHGKGAVLNKISADGGLSYTKCIAVPPESWKKSLETPTVYRLEFSDGTPDKLSPQTPSGPIWTPPAASTAPSPATRARRGVNSRPSIQRPTAAI